jgi:hypothetical protein
MTGRFSASIGTALLVTVQNAPPVMGDNEEAIENPKLRVGTVKKSIAAIASR